MATFKISGEFKLGSQMQKFKKDVEADTQEAAKEKLLALMGSKHRLARRFINVFEIVETGTVTESTVLQ